MLYGGIDIGSNAVRLLISESQSNRKTGELKKILFVRVPLRLGEDLQIQGKITKQKKEKLKYTITAFQNLLLAYDVVKYRACATASLRLATNGRSVRNYILKNCGIEVEIISGKKEAELIHSFINPEFMKRNSVYLCMDVGGGSTELTLIKDNSIIALESFAIGTLNLRSNPIKKEMKKSIEQWINKNCNEYKNIQFIGTGGNINSAAKILRKSSKKSISISELDKLRSEMSEHKLMKRMEVYQLREDRADVIIPALNLFVMVMDLSKSKKIFVPKTGLADGIIYSMLR